MGKYNPDTDTVWSTTHSGSIAHAFNSEGRALCNRSIRPRSHATTHDDWGTRAWYDDSAFTVHARCVQKLDAATQAPTEQTAPTAPAAPRSGEVTIPGGLADFLADTNLATGADDHDPASKATREALDAGRRGRGRTLIIKPGSTDVLNVISEYADFLLAADDVTAAERTAAQKWVEQAGHARKQLAADQPNEATREATKTAHASADAYIAREHPHVAALLATDPADRAAANAEANGTWRAAWIGEQQAAEVLFVVDQAEEQGALFDERAAQTE
ncbi:hypothetical protein [Streptomyces sp. BA2]|uniref:hypothetical protein n=1 Tax=Streptomyces sp. BA2 TaxID=436595 RepID=UPI00132539FF|nr:hypothetical protein [Streptomyces sp. BA2]MWA12580.1 hypothetical protein [Streptomyces sp. BA2]